MDDKVQEGGMRLDKMVKVVSLVEYSRLQHIANLAARLFVENQKYINLATAFSQQNEEATLEAFSICGESFKFLTQVNTNLLPLLIQNGNLLVDAQSSAAKTENEQPSSSIEQEIIPSKIDSRFNKKAKNSTKPKEVFVDNVVEFPFRKKNKNTPTPPKSVA